MLAPVRTRVPAPFLMSCPAPTPAPETVRAVAAWAMSNPPPLLVRTLRVKPRSVETDGPVYLRMPPLAKVRLAAALHDWPMPLATPPLASALTDRMPPLTFTGPVLILVAVRTSRPFPVLVKELPPDITP